MPPHRRHRTRPPSDRRCGGAEESELRVSLVGVSCVGTTTIGRILADRRGWPFFDLDDEIERHFGTSIERLQARFLTEALQPFLDDLQRRAGPGTGSAAVELAA